MPLRDGDSSRSARSWTSIVIVLGIIAALFAANTRGIISYLGGGSGPRIGEVAPEVMLPRYGGGEGRLTDHSGKVVLLDFWASWCGPCLRELPRVLQLEQRWGPQGLKVLSINIEGDPQRVSQVPAAKALSVLLDEQGTASQRYGVQVLPHVVVVGRDGRIVHIRRGAFGFGSVVEAVRAALERGGPGD